MRGRPSRKRIIRFWPKSNYFKPAGMPLRSLDEIELTGDELEAIRLKDLLGLEQEEVASKMEISRPVVVRILQSGRKKVADALINSRAIKIEKGNNIIMNKNCKYEVNKNKRCGRTL